MKVPPIPPLAGLATHEEAARPGYSVDQNVELMRRYNYVTKRLYEISAAFMNPTPEWEVKSALSLHLWLDGEHSQALRSRVSELRKPPLFLDNVPDDRLKNALDEVLQAHNTVELLVEVYGVVRPALLEAYRRHLAESNPVFDHPTCRAIRIAAEEQAQMIDWGAKAIEAILQTDEDRNAAAVWGEHVGVYLAAAGGIRGDEPLHEDLILPAPRATSPYVTDINPRRDARSGDIYNFHYRANDVYLDPEADWDERNLALMYKRYHEMDVPELMASIVIQTSGKPWEYYRDMGRQIWDEARHAFMGEVWFAKHGIDVHRYPNHVGWSMHLNMDRTPIERHIILYYIEQSLMNGKTGKRFEWLIAQKANDKLTTYFQDYDWADEVLHAQFGRRWLKPDVGDVKTLIERAKHIAESYSPSLDERSLSTPQLDWWPDFVREALGKESTSVAGSLNPLIPTFSSTVSG